MKTGQRSRRSAPHYFTTGRRTNERTLSEMNRVQETTFRIPPEIDSAEFIDRFREEQREERRKNRRGSYTTHQNYTSRLRLNLPERLHVPEVKALPGKSITEDIDRDFYTLVTGRKVKVNKKLGEYLRDIRNCFFTRLKIGYCTDEILRAEEKFTWERNKYEEMKRNFEVYLKSFEEFLRVDHSSSLELLRAAEAEKRKSEEMDGKMAELADRLRKLEAELVIWEEKWATGKTYQKFLYDISPSEWRRQHDRDFHSDESGASKIVDSEERPEEDLSTRMIKFAEDVATSYPPALYFDHPDQVQRIFHELETSNVIALTYCENLEKPIQRMLSELSKVKLEAEKNQKGLEEEIAFMRGLVREEENRAEALKKKAKDVVFGMCKDFIVSEEILNVTALVEDAYEDVIARNDYELNMVAMIKEIEMKYEELLLALDKFPYGVAVPAIRGFYRDEKTAEREAEEAERKYHQMEILLKRLSRSLMYPKKGPLRSIPRRLVHRSEPRKEELQKYGQLRVLSKDEKEFEYFFGRTCRNVGEAGLCRPLCAMSKTIFPSLPD